ncbi:MAG: cystathionine gamma-synthase family protein [Desulfobacterales bacterium]|nr:cystathionine gamma-synthase family protein [Desulfobacterales bacterium]
MNDPKSPGKGTLAVWGGEHGPFWERSTGVPLVHSVAFGYDDVDEWLRVGQGKAPGHIYSRNTNPTVRVFEEKIRALEDAEAATSFASGMAAVSNTLFALLSPGDRIVSIKDSYGGTNKIFLEFLPRFNIESVLCDTSDHESIEAAAAAGCKILYLESPTNPTMKIVDIARLARAAHSAGALVVVDNTFATPVSQNPLAMGADLVLHSATKYLGGHADALGGAVCGSAPLIDQIYHFREINGAVLDPAAAFLLSRGMKTLHLRVERQSENAMRVARRLEAHPAIDRVIYPGLASHPQHHIARRQMKYFGGMLAFMVKGGGRAVKTILPRLQFAHRAANLGAVETIVGPPGATSHVECTPEEMAAMGIPDSLVRYSVGIEDAEDLILDLERALEKVET